MTKQLRRQTANWITFPGALRDAIPAFKPCAGRCLELDTVEARATDSDWTGRRVSIKLRACETGKLEGIFDVWLSLNVPAAQALAEALQTAVDRASKP